MRPTSERARQAFFNIVGDRIDGARFLDLFSGSGIFSFEAVSRGAASSIAIDRDTDSITKLAEKWGVPVKGVRGDVLAVLARLSRETFDVVFADPPYDYPRYDDLLQAVDGLSLAPDPVVAVEHRRRTEPFTAQTKKLHFQRRAEYGEIWITFFA